MFTTAFNDYFEDDDALINHLQQQVNDQEIVISELQDEIQRLRDLLQV